MLITLVRVFVSSFLFLFVTVNAGYAEEISGSEVNSRFANGLLRGEIPQASTRDNLPVYLFWNRFNFDSLKETDSQRYADVLNNLDINETELPLCPNDCRSLYDASSMISEALSKANFSEQAWYLTEHHTSLTAADQPFAAYLPNLVVITEPQKINNEGLTLDSGGGITFSPPEIPPIVSGEFFSWIFRGTPSAGRYRFFIFGFNQFDYSFSNVLPPFSWRRNTREMNELRDVIRRGDRLPRRSLEGIEFDHLCTVFVYEYEISPVNGEPILVEESGLTTLEHLSVSGILEALRLKKYQ